MNTVFTKYFPDPHRVPDLVFQRYFSHTYIGIKFTILLQQIWAVLPKKIFQKDREGLSGPA
jgi:hypothetical protein